MEQVTEITKQVCESLVDRLESAVRKWADEYGLSTELGSAKFNTESFTIPLTVKVEGAEKVKWDRYCRMLGFAPDDFGKVIPTRSGKLTIIGIEPKRREFSIKVRDERGKTAFVRTSMVDREKLIERV